MWSVLRRHFFCKIKCIYKCTPTDVATSVKSCYKVTVGHYFHTSTNKFTEKQFSFQSSTNRTTGKRYDRYFYFIHDSNLYQHTTLNYNILFNVTYEKETLNFLNKVLPISDLEKKMLQLTDEELQQVMVGLITNEFPRKYKALHHLDEECARRTLKWTVNTSLSMLDGWIILDENFTFNGKFFTVLRNLWCQQIKHCSKENLVQIIYYLGRSKQLAPAFLLDRIEKLLLQCCGDITLTEWGIICNGFFKMRRKIKSSRLLHHIANTSIENIKESDKYILISVLKAFRHAHYFDENFLRFLENFTRRTYKDYNVLECAHFFAMFANVSWYNEEIFDFLEGQVIKELVSAVEAKSESLHSLSSLNIRMKDIARVLWSISHLGHKPKYDRFFEVMVNIVREFTKENFAKNILYTVDCIQSLIVMDYYCDDILCKILTKDTFEKLKLSARRKPFNQWYFIHSSVSIEAPLFKTEHLMEECFETCFLPKSTYKDTRERLGVEELINVMHRYCNEKEEFKHSFVLPHIAISSIYIEPNTVTAVSEQMPNNDVPIISCSDNQKLKICLEVLDPTVCLENYPYCMIGLMCCKVRQLRKLNYRIVMFTPEAITRMTMMSTENLRVFIDGVFNNVMAESVVIIKK